MCGPDWDWLTCGGAECEREGARVSMAMDNGYTTVVEMLTHNVRVLADSQVAKLRDLPVKIARQGLRRLERSGLVTLETCAIHPPLQLPEPLVDWIPGTTDKPPPFDAIAWQAESRWTKPLVRAVVVCATRKAQRLTGGTLGSRRIRPLELSHDITLSEIFLGLQTADPETARRWVPEDALKDFGPAEKRPDAVLRDGTTETLIELCGKAYSAKKLRAIHAAFSTRRYRIY